jgi:hypothetical protein
VHEGELEAKPRKQFTTTRAWLLLAPSAACSSNESWAYGRPRSRQVERVRIFESIRRGFGRWEASRQAQGWKGAASRRQDGHVRAESWRAAERLFRSMAMWTREAGGDFRVHRRSSFNSASQGKPRSTFVETLWKRASPTFQKPLSGSLPLLNEIATVLHGLERGKVCVSLQRKRQSLVGECSSSQGFSRMLTAALRV